MFGCVCGHYIVHCRALRARQKYSQIVKYPKQCDIKETLDKLGKRSWRTVAVGPAWAGPMALSDSLAMQIAARLFGRLHAAIG